MSFDISSLTVSDALALQNQIQVHLQTSVEQQKEQVRESIRALAQVTNKSVAATINDLFPPVPAPAKYQHPEDSTKTWSGKGTKPKWLVSLMETSGQPLEAFKI